MLNLESRNFPQLFIKICVLTCFQIVEHHWKLFPFLEGGILLAQRKPCRIWVLWEWNKLPATPHAPHYSSKKSNPTQNWFLILFQHHLALISWSLENNLNCLCNQCENWKIVASWESNYNGGVFLMNLGQDRIGTLTEIDSLFRRAIHHAHSRRTDCVDLSIWLSLVLF